jgi:hypothetical protein
LNGRLAPRPETQLSPLRAAAETGQNTQDSRARSKYLRHHNRSIGLSWLYSLSPIAHKALNKKVLTIGTSITRNRFDAVLLDLDGVITNTARIHAASWKQMFDAYLQKRAVETGKAFRPFDIATDYRLYVDGKPRFDGARDFLASRGLKLPEGTPDDGPEAETVGGLGNRKDALVSRVIAEAGVEPYEGSVRLLRRLREQGIQDGRSYL